MQTKAKTRLTIIIRVLEGVLIPLFILSFAIALPIFLRPFYYKNIDWLNLTKATGYSREVIIEAYDDVLDYLVLNREFKTGDLKHSESGKEHFADCKTIFILDFAILGISSILLCIFFILKKTKKLNVNYKKFSPAFYSGAVMVTILTALGIWGAADFKSLFNAFHAVFFPGKNNWIFSSQTDEIINILPLELWINFIYLIVAIIFIFIVAIICHEIYRKYKIKKL